MKIYLYDVSTSGMKLNKTIEYNLLRKNRFGFFMFYSDLVPSSWVSLTKSNEFSFGGNPIFFKKLKKSEEEKFHKKFREKYY